MEVIIVFAVMLGSVGLLYLLCSFSKTFRSLCDEIGFIEERVMSFIDPVLEKLGIDISEGDE